MVIIYNVLLCVITLYGPYWGGKFSTDVMLVSLDCCELILAVQWLSSLGPILWNFEKLRMEFTKEARRVVLRGIQKSYFE